MKILNVIRTKENLKDKNSDSYLAAIQAKAKKEGAEVRVITSYPNGGFKTTEFNELRLKLYCSMYPNTIVMEPAGMDFNRQLTLDKNLTARAAFNLIKELGKMLTVTIISRSDLIGNPLYVMLRDSDYTVTQCHSQTKLDDLRDRLKISDVVVTATGNDMTQHIIQSYKDFKLIDISNDVKCNVYYKIADQSLIGRKAIDLLFEELRGI